MSQYVALVAGSIGLGISSIAYYVSYQPNIKTNTKKIIHFINNLILYNNPILQAQYWLSIISCPRLLCNKCASRHTIW